MPYGRMWSSRSSWCRVNPFDERLATMFGEYLAAKWTASGLGGAYNDDLLKLVGSAEYAVATGGALIELNYTASSDQIVEPYTLAFAQMLARIREATRRWIAANVSGRNLFMETATRAYLRTLSFLLREDYLSVATGLTGYFGHLKAWDVAASAAIGVRSLVQCMLRHGRAVELGKEVKEHWEWDQESCLAQYYLLQFPGYTYLNVWGNGFNYGSVNTYSSNWWRPGVPMNVAYQPTSMLRADIGEPEPEATKALQPHNEPISYMVRTAEPLSDYTVLGDSSQARLHHAELDETGSLETQPSRVFYLARGEASVISGAPQTAVLARRYTRGLVLFRTDLFGHSQEFMESESEVLPLDGWYRRVSRSEGGSLQGGSLLGEPINEIRLKGYEGAVLVKDHEEEPTQGQPRGLHLKSTAARLTLGPQGAQCTITLHTAASDTGSPSCPDGQTACLISSCPIVRPTD